MSRFNDNPTALRLLEAAEKLFAEEGVDAVSTRRISTEAGQRNNSALQYHFGSKEALIEAILDFRQGPVNARRLQLLDELQRRGLSHDVQSLVEVLVLPFAELLNGPEQDSYYVHLVSQLYSQNRLDLLFPEHRERTRSLFVTTDLLRKALAALPRAEQNLRLELMGQTINHAVASWAYQRRRRPEDWSVTQLQQRARGLVAFLVGALQQPRAEQPWRLVVNRH